MNKIGFVFSGVFISIGIITILITNIIIRVIPVIGRVAFQAAAAGSYNPDEYHINFGEVNLLALALIVVGTVFGYYFFKKEQNK